MPGMEIWRTASGPLRWQIIQILSSSLVLAAKPAISHADILTCSGSFQALLLAQDLLLLYDLLLLVGHSLLQLLHKEPNVEEQCRMKVWILCRTTTEAR